MHVLRRRVATLDEATPVCEDRSSLRYRQSISDTNECRLELVQPALVGHGEQTRIAHKGLAMNDLDVLQWDGQPAEGFTVLPPRGGRRLWLQWRAEGL